MNYKVCELKKPYMQYVMHNLRFETCDQAANWAREKCLEAWCVVKVEWSGPGINEFKERENA